MSCEDCVSSCGCNDEEKDPQSRFVFSDNQRTTRDSQQPANEIDDYMAKELNSLSVNERDRVYDEIHGVSQAKEEDPQVIDAQLKSLEEELKRVKSKAAYERALFLSPRYVNDLRLMFLRGSEYQPYRAAIKMTTYFTNKRILFGDVKLVKKLTIDDLTEDDMAELMSGTFQQLPHKDVRGRPIIHVRLSLHAGKSWQSQLRSVWYVLMCTLEDEDAQKNGIVNLYYSVGDSGGDAQTFEVLKHSRLIDDALPYRSNSVHFCYDNSALRPVLQLLQFVSGKQHRIRFRTHFGSHMECRFSLMAFGIPNDILPLNENGNLKEGLMDAFVKNRRAIDAARKEETGDRIDYPGEFDVLHGRGRPYQEYSGNVFLATIYEARRDEYENASRFEKTVISLDIVKTIQEKGGRFIQRDKATGGWTEVSESAAREKVSSGFRVRAKRQEELGNAKHKAPNKRAKFDPAVQR